MSLLPKQTAFVQLNSSEALPAYVLEADFENEEDVRTMGFNGVIVYLWFNIFAI